MPHETWEIAVLEVLGKQSDRELCRVPDDEALTRLTPWYDRARGLVVYHLVAFLQKRRHRIRPILGWFLHHHPQNRKLGIRSRCWKQSKWGWVYTFVVGLCEHVWNNNVLRLRLLVWASLSLSQWSVCCDPYGTIVSGFRLVGGRHRMNEIEMLDYLFYFFCPFHERCRIYIGNLYKRFRRIIS